MALSKLPRQLQNSIIYHNIFDFALTEEELNRWQVGENITLRGGVWVKKDNYYFLKGRKDLIKLRLQRNKYSEQKFQIAQKASKLLSKIPTIKLVAITGSLAMENAKQDSDIDLLIITSKGVLWTTRLIVYLVLKLYGFRIRKPKDKNEKDKLCLNMWLDESDLYFDKQNVFTAHELAQIKPLVNKDKTYERLININSWIFDYWPNAIKKPNKNNKKPQNSPLQFIEPFARFIQRQYMKNKKTREVVTSTRALFHPFDWGEKVMQNLK